jgi:hypothetical protein
MFKFKEYYNLLEEGLEQKLPVMVQQFSHFTAQQIRDVATMDPTGDATKYLTWLLKYVATPLWNMQAFKQGSAWTDYTTGINEPPHRRITDEEVKEVSNRPANGLEQWYAANTPERSPARQQSAHQWPHAAQGTAARTRALGLGGQTEGRLAMLDFTDNWDDAYKIAELIKKFMTYSRSPKYGQFMIEWCSQTESLPGRPASGMPPQLARICKAPADIMSYTQASLYELIGIYEKEQLGIVKGAVPDERLQKFLGKGEAKIVLQDGPFTVFNLESDRAAKQLCDNTNWCFARGAYKTYRKAGPIYIFAKQSGQSLIPYVAAHIEKKEIKDVDDRPINEEIAKEILPTLLKMQVFEDIFTGANVDKFIEKMIKDPGDTIMSMTLMDDQNGEEMVLSELGDTLEFEFQSADASKIWEIILQEIVESASEEQMLEFIKDILADTKHDPPTKEEWVLLQLAQCVPSRGPSPSDVSGSQAGSTSRWTRSGIDLYTTMNTWISKDVGGFKRIWSTSLTTVLREAEDYWDSGLYFAFNWEDLWNQIRNPSMQMKGDFNIFASDEVLSSANLPPALKNIRPKPEYYEAITDWFGNDTVFRNLETGTEGIIGMIVDRAIEDLPNFNKEIIGQMAADTMLAKEIPKNIAWAYHSYRGGNPDELDVERQKRWPKEKDDHNREVGDENAWRTRAREGEFTPDCIDQVYWRDWLAHVYTMASRGEWVWLEEDRQSFWDTFKPIEASAKEYQKYIR